MKIVLVRGPHLNPWELQSFAPLGRRHQLTAVGADWQFYRKEIQARGIALRRAHVWGAGLGHISPRLPVYFNKALSWTAGMSFGLTDLEKVVPEADILHSVEMYWTMTHQCLSLGRRRGAKVVATVWENLPRMGERHPWRCRLKRRAIREMDGVLAVTETTRRLMIEEGFSKDKAAVIPMAVDLDRFRPLVKDPALLRRLGVSPGDVVVLFIGRLVSEKGVPDLLRAIPRVLEKAGTLPIKFVFAGDGPLDRTLKSVVAPHPRRTFS